MTNFCQDILAAIIYGDIDTLEATDDWDIDSIRRRFITFHAKRRLGNSISLPFSGSISMKECHTPGNQNLGAFLVAFELLYS